jgi:hypothetical protein
MRRFLTSPRAFRVDVSGGSIEKPPIRGHWLARLAVTLRLVSAIATSSLRNLSGMAGHHPCTTTGTAPEDARSRAERFGIASDAISHGRPVTSRKRRSDFPVNNAVGGGGVLRLPAGLSALIPRASGSLARVRDARVAGTPLKTAHPGTAPGGRALCSAPGAFGGRAYERGWDL